MSFRKQALVLILYCLSLLFRDDVKTYIFALLHGPKIDIVRGFFAKDCIYTEPKHTHSYTTIYTLFHNKE